MRNSNRLASEDSWMFASSFLFPFNCLLQQAVSLTLHELSLLRKIEPGAQERWLLQSLHLLLPALPALGPSLNMITGQRSFLAIPFVLLKLLPISRPTTLQDPSVCRTFSFSCVCGILSQFNVHFDQHHVNFVVLQKRVGAEVWRHWNLYWTRCWGPLGHIRLLISFLLSLQSLCFADTTVAEQLRSAVSECGRWLRQPTGAGSVVARECCGVWRTSSTRGTACHEDRQSRGVCEGAGPWQKRGSNGNLSSFGDGSRDLQHNLLLRASKHSNPAFLDACVQRKDRINFQTAESWVLVLSYHCCFVTPILAQELLVTCLPQYVHKLVELKANVNAELLAGRSTVLASRLVHADQDSLAAARSLLELKADPLWNKVCRFWDLCSCPALQNHINLPFFKWY